MKLTPIILLALLFAVPTFAQVPIPLAWDASATPSTPENPINYRVYKCADELMTLNCVTEEAGTDTVFGGFTQIHAEQAYYKVIAWNHEVESENVETAEVVLANLQESGPSNRLRVRVNQPPGNPDNVKIQSKPIAEIRGKPSVIDYAWNYASDEKDKKAK